MKELFIWFLFLLSVLLFSQEKDVHLSPALPATPRIIDENTIFDSNVEVQAQYPGGTQALWEFVSTHIEYP